MKRDTGIELLDRGINITPMARKLSPDDIQILIKLIPELASTSCAHAGHEYRSVLPPVSMHYSTSRDDFRERLMRLSDKELEYLVNLIFEGFESLHCVKKEHVEVLVEAIGDRMSEAKAKELLELYRFTGE